MSVSRLALGTWWWGSVLDEGTCRDLFGEYLAAGGTLVDTAHGYGGGSSEELLGRFVGDLVARDEITICTKGGAGRGVVDASRRGLLAHLDASLRRLGTDYVDLWLVHTWSDDVSQEETAGALEFAVTSGRALYVGVSNYSGWQTARAFSLLENARVPLVANQIEYSLVNREVEDELVPAAAALGFGLLAYSPLAGGVLTGKYRSGVPSGSRATMPQFSDFVNDRLDARGIAVADAVGTAATGLGVSATEVALAWVRDRPSVTAPIVGCRTVAQLRTALKSEELELPEEIVAALDEVSE